MRKFIIFIVISIYSFAYYFPSDGCYSAKLLSQHDNGASATNNYPSTFYHTVSGSVTSGTYVKPAKDFDLDFRGFYINADGQIGYVTDVQPYQDGYVKVTLSYYYWNSNVNHECNLCDDITPPDEYKNLHYSGQSYSELGNCEDAKNQLDNNYSTSSQCFSAKELSGKDNACEQYFLYTDCKTPPSEYNGLDLFYPFDDQQSCDDYKINNNFITATNCVQQNPYCPYFFYGTRGDTDPCKDIPTPNSYMGYPLAGTYQNYSSCMRAKTYYNDGDGFCMQLTDDCPLYYGYFNINGSDNNDLTDNDGDGIPDGPNPPSGDASGDNGGNGDNGDTGGSGDGDNGNNDNNGNGDNGDSGSGDGNNTNGDNGGDGDNGDSGGGGGSGPIDFTPVLNKLQIVSDKNHKDLSKINSKLSNFDQKAKNISDNTAKTVDKLDELIDLMHDQNDLLKGDNNGSGNQGLNVDMSGVEDRLDETNDHLDHIEQNISSIGSVFSRFMDLVSNPQEKIGDLIDSSIDEATDKYLGKQVIDTPDCGVIPTISFEFYGHTITLLSEDIVNQWPLEIFRKMIIFFFALAGLIHVIKDV